jgi:FlaA1/EpsC-like NDP-sugar epimerase
MGASKRIAELVCQAYASEQTGTCISIVRFGNVLWSSGSVLPRFKEQILAGGPVTVTHPTVTRYFMTIPEAAQLVMQASAMSNGGEVFVLDMGEPVCILDLARSMIRLHGLVPYLENEVRGQDGDICITFSGLRPGEKMHEELLVGSNVSGTDHPLIMCADETNPGLTQTKTLLGQLRVACDNADVIEVERIINGVAIGFKPTSAVADLTIQQNTRSMPAKRSQDKVVDIKRELRRK